MNFLPWNSQSHSIWVRGLKYDGIKKINEESESHSIWVRGLKSFVFNDFPYIASVALYMGAWIEILLHL